MARVVETDEPVVEERHTVVHDDRSRSWVGPVLIVLLILVVLFVLFGWRPWSGSSGGTTNTPSTSSTTPQ